jgi:hypothetical protein
MAGQKTISSVFRPHPIVVFFRVSSEYPLEISGDYYYFTHYSGLPSYRLVAPGYTRYLWYDVSYSGYILSHTLGGYGDFYWLRSGKNPIGLFNPMGESYGWCQSVRVFV